MLTSITLKKDFSLELSQDIISFFKKKKIKRVKVILIRELGNTIEIYYTAEDFNKLQKDIENSIEDDGVSFLIDIPELKTTFEEFVYGIEANSYENDFIEWFGKYQK